MTRIVAIIPAYNEEDIIVPSVRYLLDQGIEIYLLENWSSDRTYELVRPFLHHGLIEIERIPSGGPERWSSWRGILLRVQEVAAEIPADWFLFQGVDEIHCAPWKGLDLAAGIRQVDAEGFNCIDHAVMEFPPIDNGFTPGSDFETYFTYYEWSPHPAHFRVQNGWKNLGRPVNLVQTGGHEVRFEGRRIYPFKFLLKHYPVRSQHHGERKILHERKPRRDPNEYAIGWNRHYDEIATGHQFVRSAAELTPFDLAAFPETAMNGGLRLVLWGELAAQAVIKRQSAAVTELKEMRGSAGWRLVEFLRRLRISLVPPASAREKAWYALLRSNKGGQR